MALHHPFRRHTAAQMATIPSAHFRVRPAPSPDTLRWCSRKIGSGLRIYRRTSGGSGQAVGPQLPWRIHGTLVVTGAEAHRQPGRRLFPHLLGSAQTKHRHPMGNVSYCWWLATAFRLQCCAVCPDWRQLQIRGKPQLLDEICHQLEKPRPALPPGAGEEHRPAADEIVQAERPSRSWNHPGGRRLRGQTPGSGAKVVQYAQTTAAPHFYAEAFPSL